MATFGVGGGAPGAATSTRGLFVRNATGLVRSWATFDAFIYSFFSINLVTLGWWIFSFGPSTQGNGNLVTAIVISSILMLAEVVIYAGLIAVMPRAGGDYVWQTRVLGGGLGFVLAITGWVFTLWLWVPIYGNILAVEFISPLCTILAAMTGNHTFVTWAENATSNNGYMFASVVVAGFAALVIAAGMKVYARVQKFCFYGGMLGLLSMFVVLLVSDHNAFVSGFNHFTTTVFGVKGDAYAQTVAAASKAGFKPVPFTAAALGPSMALIPLVLFFNLHCPAYGCGLDEAPELDEQMRPKYAGHVLKQCGSTAVRAAIERHQPPLALFGHIHEGRGKSRIGRTLCINPGSSYEQGTLLGAVIDFDGRKIVDHTLTSG